MLLARLPSSLKQGQKTADEICSGAGGTRTYLVEFRGFGKSKKAVNEVDANHNCGGFARVRTETGSKPPLKSTFTALVNV